MRVPQPLSDWQAGCDEHYLDTWMLYYTVDENSLLNYTDTANAQNSKDLLTVLLCTQCE